MAEIEASPQLAGTGYSILRVKRKRHADPLEALYIETAQTPLKKPKRKEASTAGPGIFRFAATVELNIFDDRIETQRLEDCITSLVRSANTGASPINAAFAKQQRHAKHRTSAAQARYRVVQGRRQSIGDDGSEEDEPLQASRESYSKGLGRSRPGRTPFVRIWDAVEEKYQSRPRQSHASNGSSMDTFHEMLNEYLRVSDDVEARNNPALPRTDTSTASVEGDDEGSYVYDVYYRAKSPTVGEEVTESFGTLSGLKQSDLVGELSGESDSEPPMTDDEDSNEEDFYRNDYPEGEESSESEDGLGADPWSGFEGKDSDDD